MKKVYTTGEVAKLLGININTVIKWFDDGKINGFRLPGSRERRITHSALLSFMKTNKIPLELIDEVYPVQDRRAHKRYATEIPVKFVLEDRQIDGMLSNISESGAYLSVPTEYANEVRYGNFSMLLNFLGDPLEGDSTAAWIARACPAESHVGLGIRFDPKNEGLRDKIRTTFNGEVN